MDERPYPGPNPDLFAKSSARLGYYDEDYDDAPYTGEGGTSDDYYDQPAEDFHFFRTPPSAHRPGGDHRWDAGTAPDGFGKHHAWKEGDPVDWSGGYPMDPETGEDLSIDPRPRATNPDYLEGGGRVPDPTGKPIPDYEWAPGYTPSEQDKIDRSHLKHPESGSLEPGESWGHLAFTDGGPADEGYGDNVSYDDEGWGQPEDDEYYRKHPRSITTLPPTAPLACRIATPTLSLKPPTRLQGGAVPARPGRLHRTVRAPVDRWRRLVGEVRGLQPADRH